MSGLDIGTLLSTAPSSGYRQATPAGQAPASAGTTPDSAEARADAQGQEFEAIFLNTMFKSMFAGLGEEAGTWGGGSGSETWRDMLVEQYADTIARSGGIGDRPTASNGSCLPCRKGWPDEPRHQTDCGDGTGILFRGHCRCRGR